MDLTDILILIIVIFSITLGVVIVKSFKKEKVKESINPELDPELVDENSEDNKEIKLTQHEIDIFVEIEIKNRIDEYSYDEINDRDNLFEEAAEIIVVSQQGSASLLQRKLRVGYNRAGRIIDQLEAAGIVGYFNGTGFREVLIPDLDSLWDVLVNNGRSNKEERYFKEFILPDYKDYIIKEVEQRKEAIYTENLKEEIRLELLKKEIEKKEKQKIEELRKEVIQELTVEGQISAEDYLQIKREPIPQNVQDRIWNRDGGTCVKCGSNKNLEFDHIIPFSKGGSNTYRNLQLLCQTCNRSKSNNIG